MPSNQQSTRLAVRGYTLPEVMVTVFIVSLVIIGVIGFTRFGLNLYAYETGRLKVNRDIRTFTQQMATNAEYANGFALFKSFTGDRSSGTDATGNPVSTKLKDGDSGDFLVLYSVYSDPNTGAEQIQRLIGYYRDPSDSNDPTSPGPVRKFDTGNFPPSSLPLCTLLDTYQKAENHSGNPIVVQLATGSTANNGLLFYDFKESSIMIKGQITESGSLNENAVNTYNFTVSPRG